MTSEEREALHRFWAARFELEAAKQRMFAASERTARSMRALADAWRAGEVRDVQQHPDLAELDAQLNGFYG